MIVVKVVAQWTRRQIAAAGRELGDPVNGGRPVGSDSGRSPSGIPRAERSMRRWRHRPGRPARDEGRASQ